MPKKVHIIEKSSGHIVAEYPVIIELGEIKDEIYIEDAWENAVDEGLVVEGNRNDYDLEIIEDLFEKDSSKENSN